MSTLTILPDTFSTKNIYSSLILHLEYGLATPMLVNAGKPFLPTILTVAYVVSNKLSQKHLTCVQKEKYILLTCVLEAAGMITARG